MNQTESVYSQIQPVTLILIGEAAPLQVLSPSVREKEEAKDQASIHFHFHAVAEMRRGDSYFRVSDAEA